MASGFYYKLVKMYYVNVQQTEWINIKTIQKLVSTETPVHTTQVCIKIIINIRFLCRRFTDVLRWFNNSPSIALQRLA